MIAVFAAAGGAVLVMMIVLWLVSLAVRDASIVDIIWGPGFVVVAVTTFLAGGPTPRKAVLLAMVCAWGLRLGFHLLRRNWGKGEDYRYQSMRRRAGGRFWWRSAFTVFGLQGVVMLTVSLPVQIGMADQAGPAWWSLGAGGVIWLVGLVFEVVGDAQLRAFRADPDNSGQVMDRGLWRYTRHPNYFGDALLWWGHFVAASSASWGWAGFVGPVTMTFFLTRISGVPMLERRMARTKPGYAEYMEKTSSFIPLPPRST